MNTVVPRLDKDSQIKVVKNTNEIYDFMRIKEKNKYTLYLSITEFCWFEF